MQTELIVNLAAKLLTWMRADIADEREPSSGGQQVGVQLAALAVEATPDDDADRAALAFAAEVLMLYSDHVHAVAYVPTPQKVASDAADQVRKALATPVEVSPAVVASPQSRPYVEDGARNRLHRVRARLVLRRRMRGIVDRPPRCVAPRKLGRASRRSSSSAA